MTPYDRARNALKEHPIYEYLLDFTIEITAGPLCVSAGWDAAELLDKPAFILGNGQPLPKPEGTDFPHDYRPKLYRVTGLGFTLEAIIYRYPPR